jgi:hypothetical protein
MGVLQNSGWTLSGLHSTIQKRLLRFSNEKRGQLPRYPIEKRDIWPRFMREWLLFTEYLGGAFYETRHLSATRRVEKIGEA